MRDAVEERAGEPLGAEHGRPLVERQILLVTNVLPRS